MTINDCDFCEEQYPDGVQHVCVEGIEIVNTMWDDLADRYFGGRLILWLADASIALERWWLEASQPFNPPIMDHLSDDELKKEYDARIKLRWMSANKSVRETTDVLMLLAASVGDALGAVGDMSLSMCDTIKDISYEA